MNEKMSVIIPVYNVERWLEDCLNSLINQTYTNIEIIIVNDGSTDSSLEICEEFAINDNRIKIINQKNNGLGAARNIGILNATGKYIMFVDSDDYLSKNTAIEEFVTIFEKTSCEIIYTSYCRFEDETNVILEDLPLDIECNKLFIEGGKNLISELIIKKSYHHAAYLKICQYDYIVKNNLFFEVAITHEDIEWTAKTMYMAEKIYIYDARWYMRRMRTNSIITSSDEGKIVKRLCDKINIIQNLLSFFNKYNIDYQSIIIQDLVDMYWGNLLVIREIEESNYRNKCLKQIEQTYWILKLAKKRKYKIGYLLLKLLGGNNVMKIMRRAI